MPFSDGRRCLRQKFGGDRIGADIGQSNWAKLPEVGEMSV
jgi:hypothetical protein